MSRRGMMAAASAAGGGNPGGFLWKRAITIDHTQVGASDSSNFPLLVLFTDATLKTVGNGGHVQSSSGWDIGFYSESGLTTKFDWEIERWIGTTGEVVYWVRVPTVSHTVDTVIYMAYGSTAITTDQSNPHGVWDANYQLVHHYGDGSTLSVADSTSNGRNGTTSGPPIAGAGEINGGVVTSGAKFVQTTYTNPGSHDFTVSFWMNSSSNASQVGIWSWAGTSQDSLPSYLIQNNAGTLQFLVNGGYRQTTPISTGTWYFIVMTLVANATWAFYKNGSLLGTFSGTENSGSTTVFTGSGYNGQFDGTLDELRISSTGRSADWIAAEYNSQKPSQTAVTVGAETAA